MQGEIKSLDGNTDPALAKRKQEMLQGFQQKMIIRRA